MGLRALQACALVLLAASMLSDAYRSMFTPAPVQMVMPAQVPMPTGMAGPSVPIYVVPVAAPMYAQSPYVQPAQYAQFAQSSGTPLQFVQMPEPEAAASGSSAAPWVGGAVGVVAAAAALRACGLAAFAVSGRSKPARHARRSPEAEMVDIPRITLPDAIADQLKDLNLKNPNTMSDAEYNSYSGAAILGTLVIFLVPGSLIFDVKGFFFDFIFSALLGGGLMAFLALNPSTSEVASKAGNSLLGAVDKVAEKLK